jgi:hypothetical protein
MTTIVVTPGNDGNILVEVRCALQELELRGIAAHCVPSPNPRQSAWGARA